MKKILSTVLRRFGRRTSSADRLFLRRTLDRTTENPHGYPAWMLTSVRDILVPKAYSWLSKEATVRKTETLALDGLGIASVFLTLLCCSILTHSDPTVWVWWTISTIAIFSVSIVCLRNHLVVHNLSPVGWLRYFRIRRRLIEEFKKSVQNPNLLTLLVVYELNRFEALRTVVQHDCGLFRETALVWSDQTLLFSIERAVESLERIPPLEAALRETIESQDYQKAHKTLDLCKQCYLDILQEMTRLALACIPVE